MQSQSYQSALDYLYSFLDSERKLPRTPAEFNLLRTGALLGALGNPQQAFGSVIVAGTKGKGSTAVLLEAVLRAAGRRTGLWTSPHLHSYRERIQVDRRPISQDELVRAVEAIKPTLAAFDRERYGQPTTFEVGFALALRYFAERAIDLAVLEVGLGGRYDSANIVTPQLSVITSISYDHMHVLGSTLKQIAYEKAGIVKAGVPAVTVTQHPEAQAEIIRVAREVGAPLWITGEATQFEDAEHYTEGVHRFNPFDRYRGPTTTALQGLFQRENARLAVGAALLLRDSGLPIYDDAIAAGLQSARWPGRMEIVGAGPTFVLDGAHNGDSARKLIQSIGQAFPGRRLVLVLGTSEDKDLPRILAETIPSAAALVLTRSRHPRALADLNVLARQAAPLLRRDQHVPVVFTDDIPEALDEARALAAPDDVICVTGSLFVVAAAREALGIAEGVD